jgi:Domain of unknown function (DUF1814).
MSNNIESIKARLKNISQQWNKNHQLTLTRFFQERFLFRLSRSKYRKHFFLKGGVLIYVLEGNLSRPTLDLDLLANKINADPKNIAHAFMEICNIECGDGVIFNPNSIETDEITKEGNYSGVRVKVAANLGNIKQRMQIDIGFGDVIVPGPIEMKYPTFLDMEAPEILAYSVESLVAEKFEAMIDLAELNSRMKDFYDLYRILIGNKYDAGLLKEAIFQTIKTRGTKLPEVHSLFQSDFHENSKRKIQWKAFLRKSKLDEDLSFEEVMRVIKVELKPVYDSLLVL